MMKCFDVLLFIIISYCFIISSGTDFNHNHVKCLVCTRVVEEMSRNISKIDKNRMVNIGSFRLDNDGNYNEKMIPYAKSEVFLSELMDNVCIKMEDYVKATTKDGQLVVLPLVLEDGKMNPEISQVDIVQDSELNKNLKFYCDGIVADHDESFVTHFSSEEFTSRDVCTTTGVCQPVKDEL